MKNTPVPLNICSSVLCIGRITCRRWNSPPSWKRKCHFDEISLTGYTGNGHFDNHSTFEQYFIRIYLHFFYTFCVAKCVKSERNFVQTQLVEAQVFNAPLQDQTCTETRGPDSREIFVLVNNRFQIWFLTVWHHSRQPIRSHVRKSLLTNMDLNMFFFHCNPGPG